MYETDRRFFNADGSVNIEVAMAAGRKARAQDLSEGFSIVGDTAVRLFQSAWRATASFCARISSARGFQSKTA